VIHKVYEPDSEWFQVKRVYHRLKEIGVSAWFDEESMTGDINLTVSFSSSLLSLQVLQGP